MRESKDLIGKPIYSVSDGRLLGSVKDIYLDQNVYWMSGIYLGSEGLIKRKANLIRRDDVVVFGVDAVLVKNSNVITDDKSLKEVDGWLRLDDLKGREIDTPGGTKVAAVGDVILDEEARVTAIKLSRAFVEGPIAEKMTVPRDAVIDTGSADGVMTIDLIKAERVDAATPPAAVSPDEDSADEQE